MATISNRKKQVGGDIDLKIKGEVATAVRKIGKIIGEEEERLIIMRALREFEWVLAQQTLGCVIISKSPRPRKGPIKDREIELSNLIKDKALAERFFAKRDIFF